MKTFKQLINEELLNEAIKIDNAEQALDLILNKKIGVKVHPSWLSLLTNPQREPLFIKKIDEVINDINDKTLATPYRQQYEKRINQNNNMFNY